MHSHVKQKTKLTTAFDYLRDGLFSEAIDIFKLHLDQSDACCGLARCYQAQNKHDDAIKLLTKTIKDFPNDMEAYKALAFALDDAKKTKEAFETAELVKKKFPKRYSAHLCEIHLLRKNGKTAEALSKYKTLVQLFPKQKSIQFEMCVLLSLMGEKTDIILAKYAELFKDKDDKSWAYKKYLKARFHYSIELQTAGFYEESFNIQQELMKENDEDCQSYVRKAHLSRAFGLEKCQALDKAKDEYLQILSLYPKYYYAHLIYCIFLQKHEEDVQLTLDQYQNALKKFPNSKELHLGLSIWYLNHATLENDYLKLALVHAKAALKADPEYAAAYSQMGHCYSMMIRSCYRSRKGTYEKLKLHEKSQHCFDMAHQLDKTRLDKHKPSWEESLVSVFFRNKISEFNSDADEIEQTLKVKKRSNTIIELLNRLTSTTEKWDAGVLVKKQTCRELSTEILDLYEKLDIIIETKKLDLEIDIQSEFQRCEDFILQNDFTHAILLLRQLLAAIKLHLSAEKVIEFIPQQGLQLHPDVTAAGKPQISKTNTVAKQLPVKQGKQEESSDDEEDNGNEIDDSQMSKCFTLMIETGELLNQAQQRFPKEDFSRQQKRVLAASENLDANKYSAVIPELYSLQSSISKKVQYLLEKSAEETSNSKEANMMGTSTNEVNDTVSPNTPHAQKNTKQVNNAPDKKPAIKVKKTKPSITTKKTEPVQNVQVDASNQNVSKNTQCLNRNRLFALAVTGTAIAVTAVSISYKNTSRL